MKISVVSDRIKRSLSKRVLISTASLMPLFHSKNASADINLIEGFIRGNDLECTRLWFEGFCLWFVVTAVPYPPFAIISLEATPQISHYTPDLMISVTGVQGTSPSIETREIYERLSVEINQPLVEALTGHDVPNTYRDEDYSSGKSGDAGRARTGYNFSEAVIVGSPGNIMTLYSEGAGSIAQIPVNALQGFTDTLSTAAGIPADVASTVGAVVPGSGGVDDLGELADQDPTLYGQWVDSEFGPTFVAQLLFGQDVVDATQDLANVYNTITALDVQDLADAQATITDAAGEITQQVNDALNGGGTGGTDTGGGGNQGGSVVEEVLGDITNVVLEELTASLQGELQEIIELVEDLEEIADLVQDAADVAESITGGAFEIHSFKNFCPRSGEVFKPYYLSSLDVIGWRWRLPEIIYPQTYAPAIPGRTTQFNVGQYGGGSGQTFNLFGVDLTMPDYNHWGPIYPRAGGVLQPDVDKARAVAAARAAHIVTSGSGQPHIYWPLETNAQWRNKHDGDWHAEDSWQPGTYNPQDERSGSWQLLTTDDSNDGHRVLQANGIPSSPKGETERSCFHLGQGDAFVGTNTFANQMNSDDKRHLYNLWRRYECCEDPETSNSRSRYLRSVSFPLQIL